MLSWQCMQLQSLMLIIIVDAAIPQHHQPSRALHTWSDHDDDDGVCSSAKWKSNNHFSFYVFSSRLTSTGDDYDDDHECHSEHETSWDELEEQRLENFTAGRERLQEFRGKIPPRKKKKEAPKTKPKAKVRFLEYFFQYLEFEVTVSNSSLRPHVPFYVLDSIPKKKAPKQG